MLSKPRKAFTVPAIVLAIFLSILSPFIIGHIKYAYFYTPPPYTGAEDVKPLGDFFLVLLGTAFIIVVGAVFSFLTLFQKENKTSTVLFAFLVPALLVSIFIFLL